ncbi:SGNH/GDSL hydrolase family protein [Flavivirga eckloniae]|uniref:SGNH hydrolase-type esterase domain-containing protein n=1 Tax=Flavivirga eckloniae TaxID=1803846 RepID=A0A2K9PQN6_9FLAO|nr:SGNH/GDSL hydrolase family protein [Flavivirga eckloniae]AUP79390.1 hypothetical protein C1H87_11995 [Flavivirga eckloniae]
MMMPGKKVFRITWLIILIFLLGDFILKADKTFLSLNYLWEDMILIETYENIEIDSISTDYLKIKLSSEGINVNHTFALNDNEPHYFRATSIKKKDSIIIFSGIKWLNGHPESVKRTIFQIVDLPIKQTGSVTVTTIGDSQMLWRAGREFRKNLSLKSKDIVFKGKERDVYGYASEAKTFNTIKKVIKSVYNIEDTQNYILFIGAHDRKNDKVTLNQGICQIYEILSSRKSTQKIIVITLPPSSNDTLEAYNKSFNSILKKCSHHYESVFIIDLYEYLLDKQGYLQEDGVHLNEYGHKLLSKLILETL